MGLRGWAEGAWMDGAWEKSRSEDKRLWLSKPSKGGKSGEDPVVYSAAGDLNS